MTIEQYVRATKHSIDSAKAADEIIPIEMRSIFDEVSTGLFTKPFNVYPICSSNVFPEIIHLNQTSYLLWDSMFWEFFDTYMICAATLKKHKNNPELIRLATMLLNNTYIEFLAYKLESIPEISFCLANDIIPINRQKIIEYLISILDDRFNQNVISGVWYQARLHVFFHEIHHVFYRENPNNYKEVISYIQQLCKTIVNKDLQQYLRIDDLDKVSKEIERKAFDSIIEETNNVLMEEIACDFQSFITLQSILEPIYKERLGIVDSKKIISDIQESMRLCLSFQTEVTYILSVWRETIKMAKNQDQFSQKNTSYDMEKAVLEFQSKIDNYKIGAFTRNAVFFQVSQTNCIIKHRTYSFLEDILSDEDVRNILFPVSNQLLDNNYMWAKILQGLTFQADSKLMPYQQIEARDMLIALNKTMLNDAFIQEQ